MRREKCLVGADVLLPFPRGGAGPPTPNRSRACASPQDVQFQGGAQGPACRQAGPALFPSGTDSEEAKDASPGGPQRFTEGTPVRAVGSYTAIQSHQPG